eukprot:scaffold28378_cov223-Skeletonema_marinoi.AAC.14
MLKLVRSLERNTLWSKAGREGCSSVGLKQIPNQAQTIISTEVRTLISKPALQAEWAEEGVCEEG